MYRKFLTARSPLRLLEKGLHGGLGPGNLGIVVAGHGVGKPLRRLRFAKLSQRLILALKLQIAIL